jgi:hypothetical protein
VMWCVGKDLKTTEYVTHGARQAVGGHGAIPAL